jgi:alkylation response protein AidB-like acyl-CoA dehydrogenase
MVTATGFQPDVWTRLCTELGVAGAAVPEEFGGAGWSTAEAAAIAEEAGRALLCAPLFSVAGLAIPQLLASGDRDACARWLPGLADGSLLATVAAADPHGRHPARGLPIAIPQGDGWSLTGKAGYVVDAATADLLLIPAATPDGVGLFAVQARVPGLTVTSLTSLDLTRRQAHLSFEECPASLVGEPDAGDRIIAGFDVARSILAAEQVGGAAECLDVTVDYAKQRVQFGRPIGSFQAVKQKCADMLISVESARSAAVAAASATAAELSVNAAVASSFCSATYVSVAATSIQLHGGIGFTWEHDAHLRYKRARTSAVLLGGVNQHLDTVAAHLSTEFGQ